MHLEDYKLRRSLLLLRQVGHRAEDARRKDGEPSKYPVHHLRQEPVPHIEPQNIESNAERPLKQRRHARQQQVWSPAGAVGQRPQHASRHNRRECLSITGQGYG